MLAEDDSTLCEASAVKPPSSLDAKQSAEDSSQPGKDTKTSELDKWRAAYNFSSH